MTLYSRESLSAIRQQAVVPLGMAQLSVVGLSEDWWLKHLGDVHWQMIATAMGQDDPLFRDVRGRLIYAAFCATEFEQPWPEGAALGGTLQVTSSLWQAGRSRLQSIHEVFSDTGLVARVRMVSTFVTHGAVGVNKSVARVSPAIIPVLPKAPDGFADQAAQHARRLRAGLQMRHPAAQGEVHQPVPDLDFNAVGLLYFPSFTRIATAAEAAALPVRGALRSRVMLYFGNVEMGESLRSGVEAPDMQRAQITLWDGEGSVLATCFVTRHPLKLSGA